MKKLLFLGCNDSQIPYLRAARALGYRVIATDRNPAAPGAAEADRFEAAGYADADALLRVARDEELGPTDRVFTASAHHAYAGASRVAAALGIPFPSPDAVETCLDKSRLYALLGELEVPFPPTRTWLAGEPPPPREPGLVYYLKSDYGKTPHYCFRLEDGELPPLPERFDAFYRGAFLLQEEVQGAHFRIDLYGAEVAVFLRVGTASWLPLPVLGPGHDEVARALRRVVAALGLEKLLVKFDVVAGETGWHLLDVGLDRPLRVLLLCRHLGLDFEAAYTRAYLEGDPAALPSWKALCRPLLISGDPDVGYRVAAVEPGP